MTFESSTSVSVRVGEESLEDNLNFESVWSDLKANIWILRCFVLEYQVSSKSEQVRCQNQNASHVCQTITCKKWSFHPKSSNLVHKCASWNFYFKSWRKMFQYKNEVNFLSFDKNASASQNGFVDVMRSLMKKKFSKFGEMCFKSKWKVVKWVKSWVLKHGSVSHLKILVCEWKIS